MLRSTLKALFVVGCLALACRMATAQEVVHALTGTVSAIDPGDKTITIFTDGHTQSQFNDLTGGKVPVSFDKRIRADASPVDTFKKEGAYVIVYYYGGGNGKTAVALRNLGSGPFTQDMGTVAKFESRDHSISVKDPSGVVQSFKITPDTVAETSFGAVDGLKFQAPKGEQLRVLAANVDGSPTALFISAM